MRKTSIWLSWPLRGRSLVAAPATASPNCLRGHPPFTLKDDTVNGSSAKRGPECLQGLRWSYMQIYSVAVVTPPKHGTLVIMGSGFRYVANATSEANGDSFKLAVVGKNRHDHGASTIEIVVGAASDPG